MRLRRRRIHYRNRILPLLLSRSRLNLLRRNHLTRNFHHRQSDLQERKSVIDMRSNLLLQLVDPALEEP